MAFLVFIAPYVPCTPTSSANHRISMEVKAIYLVGRVLTAASSQSVTSFGDHVDGGLTGDDTDGGGGSKGRA